MMHPEPHLSVASVSRRSLACHGGPDCEDMSACPPRFFVATANVTQVGLRPQPN